MVPQLLMSGEGDGTRTRRVSSCAVPARAVRAGIALALLIPHLTGCFQYVPVSHTAIPSGTEVVVGVTDRGRVALTEPVGPGVRRLGGSVLESTDTSLVLSVSTVEFVDLDIPVKLTGQQVGISRDFITEVRERRLSRSRTWLTVGLVAVAAVAISFIAIGGFGGGDPGTERPPNGNEPD